MTLLVTKARCDSEEMDPAPDFAIFNIDSRFVEWCKRKMSEIMDLGDGLDERPFRVIFPGCPCSWFLLPCEGARLEDGHVVTFDEGEVFEDLVENISDLDAVKASDTNVAKVLQALDKESPGSPFFGENVHKVATEGETTEFVFFSHRPVVRFNAVLKHTNIGLLTNDMSVEKLQELID